MWWRDLVVTAGLVTLLTGAVCRPVVAATASDDYDPRSHAVLAYLCTNELGQRDVTLFANGTIRVREGLWPKRDLLLDEMGPDELATYVARLGEIQDGLATSGGADFSGASISGEWLERCSIELDLPQGSPLEIHFSGYDVPPLVVAQLIHVAEELAEYTRSPDPVERLPADYEPRAGDVLRTASGERFRIMRFTIDERGLELDGISQPLRIYVAIEQLAESFVAVEPAGGR